MRIGFSLIEVLVVVVVIAMLAAILLPAMGNAREAGRTALCASNLRQGFLACRMYQHGGCRWLQPAGAGAETRMETAASVNGSGLVVPPQAERHQAAARAML